MSTSEKIISLNCVKYKARCDINLYGCTVVSWISDGEELLFVSAKSHLDGTKAIRGGIPLVFPNFGPWELGPQHGFGRIQWWNVEKEPKQLENGDVVAVFSLTDNEATRAMWNYSFKLLYTVTLSDKTLTTQFTVENKGDSEFDFTCLLHTYFRVPDIAHVTVSGLSGLSYIDKVKNGEEFKEDRPLVTISENVDRVYKSTKDDHIITGVPGGHTIKVIKQNLPDTVVWNPWAEKAAGMSDFGDDEYPNMICVEAGYVADRCKLAGKKSFSCGQTLTLVPKAAV